MRFLDDTSTRITFGIGIFLSLIWVIVFYLYIDTQIGWGNVEVLLPSEQGGLLAGLTAPLGFLWLFLAFLKRGNDVQHHTEALQAELRKLSYPLTEAEAKTMRIADALRRQVDTLNAASDRAQAQLAQTNVALGAQTREIASLADQIAGKVNIAQEALAKETSTLDSRISGVGKTLRGHVADLEIQLADAGRRLENQAAGFASQVEAAKRALADPAAEMAALGDKLAAQPAAFAKSAREQGAALAAAFDAAGERFAQTTRGHAEQLIGAASRAAVEVETQLRDKADDMNTLFDRLVSQGKAAQALMQAHLADIVTAAGEAGNVGASLRASLQENIDGLRHSAAESGEMAKDMGTILESRAIELSRSLEAQSRSLTEALVQHGESLSDLLQQQNEALIRNVAEGGGEAIRGLRRESESVAAAIGELQRQTLTVRESLQAQSAESTVVAGRIADEAQAIVAVFRNETKFLSEATSQAAIEAREIAATLHSQVRDIAAAATRASESVTTLQGEVGSRLQQIAAETDTAAGRAANVAETYRQRALELGEATEREHGRIAAVGRAMREEAAALTKVSVDTMERHLSVATAFRDQTDDLGRIVQQGDSRVGQLRQTVQSLSEELTRAATAAAQQAENATQSFRNETGALMEVARAATAQVSEVRNSVSEQMNELGQLALRSGQLAQSVRDMLTKPVAELTAAAKLAEGQAGTARADVAALREEIQQQAQHLTAAADLAARQLETLGGEIDAKAEALVGATDYALNNAGNIGNKFEEQASKLGTAVGQALNLSAALGQHLQKQSEALALATAAARQQISTLTDSQQQTKTEVFLRAAADLVAELNSLSLDMTSLLDADVPDEVWRRYKDGDRSAFARRLLRLKDSYVIPALEQRYAKDVKFRDLVMRFTGKFEDLLTQAGRADPDHVLSTAFLTADIGKLYLLIQRNLGKSTAH